MVVPKKVVFLAQLGVTVLMLGWVFSVVEWRTLWEIIQQADPIVLLVAFLLPPVCYALQGARLFFLLREQKGSWAMGDVVKTYWLGVFHDIYLPANLGGDAFRFMHLKEGGESSKVLAAIAALRVQGVLCLVVLSSFGAGYYFHSWHLGFLGLTFSCAAIAGMIWLVRRKVVKDSTTGKAQKLWGGRFGRAVTGVTVFAGAPRILACSFGLYFVFLLVNIVLYWLVLRGFNCDIALGDLITGVPVLMFVVMLPVTVQGRGLSEWLAISMWQSPTCSPEQIVSAVFCIYSFVLCQGLLTGIYWILVGRRM